LGSVARFARGNASAAAAIPFPQTPFPRRSRLRFVLSAEPPPFGGGKILELRQNFG